MKITGIICEYNPFHKGHKYQLEKARELTGADVIICAMSGACVQRGDIAVTDKWSRAKSALLCGADVVFELPALFAVRAAQDFAMGGVSLLNFAQADHISFGCEIDDLSALEKLAFPPPDLDAGIKNAMQQGFSYPRAVQAAIDAIGGRDEPLLSLPNAVLGLEYLRAIKQINPTIKPMPVLRDRSDGLSASLVRELLKNGDIGSAKLMLPDETHPLIDRAIYNSLENAGQSMLFHLRNIPPENLAEIMGIGEGLEHRIISAANSSASLSELFTIAKTKRYTMARIRRAVLSSLLGITADLCAEIDRVPYLRILAFRKTAAPYLASLRESAAVPVITKFADAQQNRCLEIDKKAQDLFDLALGAKPGRDFSTSPVIL